ncbi:MAG: phosphotransferase [Capsulimonadales bacterium]|nr:phosphotransferase [Capsulimonadales bacterium]
MRRKISGGSAKRYSIVLPNSSVAEDTVGSALASDVRLVVMSGFSAVVRMRFAYREMWKKGGIKRLLTRVQFACNDDAPEHPSVEIASIVAKKGSKAMLGDNTAIVSKEDVTSSQFLLQSLLQWPIDSIGEINVLRHHDSIVVSRLKLISHDPMVPSSVIVKVAPCTRKEAKWGVSETQIRLFEQHAPLPKTYWSGKMPDNESWLQIEEDLATTCRLFAYDDTFSVDQMLAVTEAVAKFHVAGIQLGAVTFARTCPWIVREPLCSVNGDWVVGLARRARASAVGYGNDRVLRTIEAVGERYDAWLRLLDRWTTIVHGDIFARNVAIGEDKDGKLQGRLLDLDAAMQGLPQYDLEYMTMRDWRTDADWDALKRHHCETAQRLLPDVFDDEELWWWGYRLARIQLMLIGTNSFLERQERLSRGEVLSEGERRRIRAIDQLFDNDFVDACQSALREDPVR